MCESRARRGPELVRVSAPVSVSSGDPKPSVTVARPIARQVHEVVATYEGIGVSGRFFRNTEVLTIRDGEIVEVEVYFRWNVCS